MKKMPAEQTQWTGTVSAAHDVTPSHTSPCCPLTSLSTQDFKYFLCGDSLHYSSANSDGKAPQHLCSYRFRTKNTRVINQTLTLINVKINTIVHRALFSSTILSDIIILFLLSTHFLFASYKPCGISDKQFVGHRCLLLNPALWGEIETALKSGKEKYLAPVKSLFAVTDKTDNYQVSARDNIKCGITLANVDIL